MHQERDSVAARVLRGSAVEALHAASIAVVDATGALTHVFGDPSRAFVMRSATKPFQALPLVTSGAADALGVDERELAIACASHDGDDRHVEVVQRLLARAGAGPEALQCGAHLPIGLRVSGKPATRGEDRDPLRNNCSGKHAGFLALSRHLGAPFPEYLEPEGAVQREVRRAVEAACELSPDAVDVAVDGCSAPTFAFPLAALAAGFKNLALADAHGDARARALARIRDAMLHEPLLVSGPRRFDHALARSFPENAVAKGGAEAVLGVGFRDPPLGIALKIHDGGARALYPVCVRVLHELGVVDDVARFPFLLPHARPDVVNHARRRTGEIVTDFALRRTGAR